MITLLRIVRGFFGLIFVWQILTLLPALGLLGSVLHMTGGELAMLAFKIVLGAISGALFFAMRPLINWLHVRKHGSPHPALGKRSAV